MHRCRLVLCDRLNFSFVFFFSRLLFWSFLDRHFFCSCLLFLPSVLAFCSCILFMHSVLAFCSCILLLHSVLAFCSCVLFLHSVAAFCSCILFLHSVLAFCACRCRRGSDEVLAFGFSLQACNVLQRGVGGVVPAVH